MTKTTRKKNAESSAASERRSVRATVCSTAGSGFEFEDQVAARLLLKMLTGEAIPGMDGYTGLRLQSQTNALGWLIDDLLMTYVQGSKESHLALSCKSNLQVTSSGLPKDFVSTAWNQFINSEKGPFHRSSDRIALVTRGHHLSFDALWADIKNACTGSDPALAIARIRQTRKHEIIFNNIKNVVQESSADIRDEDALEFIRRRPRPRRYRHSWGSSPSRRSPYLPR